ncbi:MAG: ABC transporter ATP-binding protein [Chloroflexi bacterium]|nr:ABC transporter ATP-binding protein [Chloroflexota bacterium]
MPLLEVEDLAVAYGAIVAVRGASFSVDEGQIVTLIGPNGAGKSTILNAISGLLRPRSGAIRFAGASLRGLAPHQVTARGVVQAPEGRAILATLTVRENLELGGVQRRDGKELQRDIAAMLERFPILGRRSEQPAGALSGGEQQMLAIARALVARPRLLLLDEPSMGLAPRLVQEVFAIVDELHRAGNTILLVEQNARQALAISEMGYVLEGGAVVMSGPSATLLDDPRVVAAYLGAGYTT